MIVRIVHPEAAAARQGCGPGRRPQPMMPHMSIITTIISGQNHQNDQANPSNPDQFHMSSLLAISRTERSAAAFACGAADPG